MTFIKDAIKDFKLIPLDELVANNPKPVAENKALALTYAESWGLFHYLYKYNRYGMEKFIVLYKSHAPYRAISPDERRVIFTAAFGNDIDGLNNKYLAYLRSLPGRPN